jgi:hypothetical protein
VRCLGGPLRRASMPRLTVSTFSLVASGGRLSHDLCSAPREKAQRKRWAFFWRSFRTLGSAPKLSVGDFTLCCLEDTGAVLV